MFYWASSLRLPVAGRIDAQIVALINQRQSPNLSHPLPRTFIGEYRVLRTCARDDVSDVRVPQKNEDIIRSPKLSGLNHVILAC